MVCGMSKLERSPVLETCATFIPKVYFRMMSSDMQQLVLGSKLVPVVGSKLQESTVVSCIVKV